MKRVETLLINCKIEFGLKVGFAIYQVQCFLFWIRFETCTPSDAYDIADTKSRGRKAHDTNQVDPR